MTFSLGIDSGCRFSKCVSSSGGRTWGDAARLMPCHLHFVSNSCHFCGRCICGPLGMLGLSVCRPSRKDGIASRGSGRSGRCTSAEAGRRTAPLRTAPLRTNLLESGCPRTVSASNLCIFVIIHILPSPGDVQAGIGEKPAPGPPLALTLTRIASMETIGGRSRGGK
jgi:hypothetical protein